MRTWAVVFTNMRGPSLIVDGATQGGAFWTETVTISPGTNYELGFWGVWCNTNNNGDSTASIQVFLNGLAVGKPVDLPPDCDGCPQGRMKFNSGSATEVTISLVDLHSGDPWNDLAADEISLKAMK